MRMRLLGMNRIRWATVLAVLGFVVTTTLAAWTGGVAFAFLSLLFLFTAMGLVALSVIDYLLDWIDNYSYWSL